MTQKKELGQFFTTNSDSILLGFEDTVRGKVVMDPFAGGGDLLKWAEKNGATTTSGCDIDKVLCVGNISYNDSLVSIPRADFNITNPPYLAKNKMTPAQKQVYPMEEYEDLYLLSMKKIIESGAPEGIIIIPVNFFSAENSDKLRKEFLTKYTVAKVNYFREQVFADTTYNVVAFHYAQKSTPSTEQSVVFTFYPDKSTKTYVLEEQYDYRIAGRELDKYTSVPALKVTRLTEDHMKKNPGSHTIAAIFNDKDTEKKYQVSQSFASEIHENVILLNCIDTNGTEAGWIKAEDITQLGYDCLVGKNTSRNIAYILLADVSTADQKEIIGMFNDKLNTLRKQYNSLFLTNFRDNDRKRVSFEFCYKLISFCYREIQKSKSQSNRLVGAPRKRNLPKQKEKAVRRSVREFFSMSFIEIMNHPYYNKVLLRLRKKKIRSLTKEKVKEVLKIILRHKD